MNGITGHVIDFRQIPERILLCVLCLDGARGEAPHLKIDFRKDPVSIVCRMDRSVVRKLCCVIWKMRKWYIGL
jgi:hypothetical protein